MKMDDGKKADIIAKIGSGIEIVAKGLVKGIIGLVKAVFEAFR